MLLYSLILLSYSIRFFMTFILWFTGKMIFVEIWRRPLYW